MRGLCASVLMYDSLIFLHEVHGPLRAGRHRGNRGARRAATQHQFGEGNGELGQAPGLEEPTASVELDEEANPTGEDQGELIPAEGDRLQQIEMLLTQEIEKNKNLKQLLQTDVALELA